MWRQDDSGQGGDSDQAVIACLAMGVRNGLKELASHEIAAAKAATVRVEDHLITARSWQGEPVIAQGLRSMVEQADKMIAAVAAETGKTDD